MDFVEVSQRPECRCIPRTSLFIGRRMFFSIYRLSHGRHPNTQHPAVRQCIDAATPDAATPAVHLASQEGEMRDASGARTTKFQVDRILRFKAARPSDPP